MLFSTKKPMIVFYEKTGCSGNERQKALLRSYGLELDVKSLLDTKWKQHELAEFFQNLPIEEIVNPFAPQVKNKEINITSISKEHLVQLMIETPLLIKRPLMEVNGDKICGFDTKKLGSVLNMNIDAEKDISTCQSSDKCKSV